MRDHATDIDRVCDRIEWPAQQIERTTPTQFGAAHAVETKMVDVLRPVQQRVEFHRPRRPAGDIVRQHLQQRERALAPFHASADDLPGKQAPKSDRRGHESRPTGRGKRLTGWWGRSLYRGYSEYAGLEGAEKLGIRGETISRWRQDPHFEAALNSAKMDLVESLPAGGCPKLSLTPGARAGKPDAVCQVGRCEAVGLSGSVGAERAH